MLERAEDICARAEIASVQTGQIGALGKEQVPSAFVKSPIHEPVEVHRLGLAGDAQADLSLHGGPDKAVYGYPLTHYLNWLTELPHHAPLLRPGGFGENLTFAGCDENTVCLGDIMRIGSAVLQVTQPRQPCFKLALRFDLLNLPKMMMKNGRCGWYLRVLEPGWLQAGDRAGLVERANPGWPVARFQSLISGKLKRFEDMIELARMPGLADEWRQKAQAVLASRQT